MRTHPALIARATATTQQLFASRFRFGIGSGEALNEHILGHAVFASLMAPSSSRPPV